MQAALESVIKAGDTVLLGKVVIESGKYAVVVVACVRTVGKRGTSNGCRNQAYHLGGKRSTAQTPGSAGDGQCAIYWSSPVVVVRFQVTTTGSTGTGCALLPLSNIQGGSGTAGDDLCVTHWLSPVVPVRSSHHRGRKPMPLGGSGLVQAQQPGVGREEVGKDKPSILAAGANSSRNTCRSTSRGEQHTGHVQGHDWVRCFSTSSVRGHGRWIRRTLRTQLFEHKPYPTP